MGSRLSLYQRNLAIVWLTVRLLVSYQLLVLLSPFMGRERMKVRWKVLHKKNASLLRDTALQLKGVLIKLGQFMSARIDVLPEEYTDELSQLQDQVPPADFSDIRKRIIEELGADPQEIFSPFADVPIAAASLGQVHEAYLKTGERVAVKIQYPGIEEIVKTDLKLIRWGTRLLHRYFPTVRFDVLYEEFSRVLHEELNYIQEGKNAESFRKNFLDDPKIVAPRVIWEYTTPHLLTLEFVEGIKITNFDEIRAKGIDLTEIAQVLVESYMKQILLHRFFHGDPHPGNLFVREGPRIVFVDFGLMQKITPQMHEGTKQTMMAVIERDIPGIVQGLIRLGFIARTEDLRDVERVVEFFMNRYRDFSPKEFRTITIHDIGMDLREIFRVSPSLQIPNDFILFGRAAGILNGLCSQLDPRLNIVELAKPYVEKFVPPKGGFERIMTRGKEWGRAFFVLPEMLEKFIKTANSEGVKTRMSSEDVVDALTKLYMLLLRTLLGAFALVLFFLAPLAHLNYGTLAGATIGGVCLLLVLGLLWTFVRDIRPL